MTVPHPGFDPLSTYEELPPEEMVERSRRFAALMRRRRTVRQFSDRPVSRAVIEACLEAAGTAPYLIAIFAQRHGTNAEGTRTAHYYVMESVGIATGVLITALHQAGLVTLTRTPNPVGFLSRLLGRPASERPVMILVAGYPASGAVVPRIGRKPLAEIVSWR